MTQQNRTRTAVVAASGAATIVLETYGGTWTVTQVSIELATAPVGAQAALRLYRSGSAVGFLVTPLVATGDVASGDPPIVVAPEDTLQVEWTGCTPGDLTKALFVYDDGTGP